MPNEKRKIGIIIGSRADLKECLRGLSWLEGLAHAGYIEFTSVSHPHRGFSHDVIYLLVSLTDNRKEKAISTVVIANRNGVMRVFDRDDYGLYQGSDGFSRAAARAAIGDLDAPMSGPDSQINLEAALVLARN